MRKIIFVGFTLLLCAGITYGQKKEVAVLKTVSTMVSEDIQGAIQDALEEGVVNSKSYTLVARGEAFRKAMREFKFQESGAVDDDQLIAAGHAMGADFVCYATIRKIGSDFRIAYKFVDVGSSVIPVMGSKSTRNGENDLFRILDEIAVELFGGKGAGSNNSVGNSLSWHDLLKKAISTNSIEHRGYRCKGLGAQYGFNAVLGNNGDMYIGGFIDGNMNGFGIFIGGDAYHVSFWSKGSKSGHGTVYDKDGNLLYYGSFENDKPTEIYPNGHNFSGLKFEVKNYGGAYYIGETENGKKSGHGIVVQQNGDIWYGYWADDLPGSGTYIRNDGSITTGKWQTDTYTP